MYLYVVTAYRYGNREKHSYVVGVFDTELEAVEVAEEIPEERAGKYYAEVIKLQLNVSTGDVFNNVLPLSRLEVLKYSGA